MDIPAFSMSLARIEIENSVGIAMLSKSLDTMETTGAAMVQMMSQSLELTVNPNVGGNIDLSL